MSRIALWATLLAISPGCAGQADGDGAAGSQPAVATAAPLAPPERVQAAAPPPRAAAARIVVSAVGDCTLGSDFRVLGSPGSFTYELEQVGGDLRYPFSGVVSVLSNDDLTIANLEGSLGTSSPRSGLAFAFRGKPEYVGILRAGSVEVVDLANNHAHDLGFAGLDQTVETLRTAGVGYFGWGHVDRRTIKGVEIVNLGYTGGGPGVRASVERDVGAHKKPDNLVFVSFHWGIEGLSVTTTDQIRLGRAAVDAGADLVLGHHPHVLQGIERYRGKSIVYSLGNFVFGGHSNPRDKDSMIFQQVFEADGAGWVPVESRTLPVRISSSPDRNDYRPVLLEGEDRDVVLARLALYAQALAPAGAASPTLPVRFAAATPAATR